MPSKSYRRLREAPDAADIEMVDVGDDLDDEQERDYVATDDYRDSQPGDVEKIMSEVFKQANTAILT